MANVKAFLRFVSAIVTYLQPRGVEFEMRRSTFLELVFRVVSNRNSAPKTTLSLRRSRFACIDLNWQPGMVLAPRISNNQRAGQVMAPLDVGHHANQHRNLDVLSLIYLNLFNIASH